MRRNLALAACLAGMPVALQAQQPVPPSQHSPSPPELRRDIVLASVDETSGPTNRPPQSQPRAVKRITPRITTCRCGDPVDPEPKPEE